MISSAPLTLLPVASRGTQPSGDYEHIADLESLARNLEPTHQQWDMLATKVLRYSREFLDDMPVGQAYSVDSSSGAELLESPITEDGISVDTALRLLEDNVDTVGLNPASSRFLGFIPGGGVPVSAFGDFLAAIFNRYSGVFFTSPGAVRMENMLVRWMASVAGFPSDSGGFLASGGSQANMSAVVAAREAHGIRSADVPKLVVYLTKHAHHCVDKGLRITGMRESQPRRIPVDSNFRMDAGALDEAIRQDKAKGLRPWLIVSSAGTTNAGAVDPLRDIHEIATTHGLWNHVDGAYGAFFNLCPEGAEALDGMESCDSLVLDPHKSLFIPYGTGALLVRDRALLGRAHAGWSDYFQDIVAHPTELSPAYVSPELTRHFRGLRLWLPLKLHGLAPFRAALSEKILLARYFYEQLHSIDGFEVGPYPDLSIVTYRYVPKRGDADIFNLKLVQRILDDGRLFITSTRIGGKVMLRMAVGCFRTHRDDIDIALEVLRDLSAEQAAL